MKPTRFAFIAWCVSLATCCPTLWIQVTKTDPSPWPELPTPAAAAPSLPTQMQNRFDVFAGGAVVRDATGFRDAIDGRNNQYAQSNAIAKAMDQLIHDYGVRPLSCSGELHDATIKCVGGQCNYLEMTTRPIDGWVIVDGHLRTATASSKWTDIGVPIDDAKEHPVKVCTDVALISKPLLGFVHASDIQLRDPSVVLTDRRISKRLDWFRPLSSFEYDEDLAFYNQYLLEAIVETVNQAAVAGDPDAPSFVIHTGDSIDSNMRSELERFHSIIDRLKVPFFNVFGNHDVLVFGNLTPTDQVGEANDDKCTPISALLGKKHWAVPKKLCVDSMVRACKTCTQKQVEFIASTSGHAQTRKNFIEVQNHPPTSPVVQFPRETGPNGETVYCSTSQAKAPLKYDAKTYAHGFDRARDDHGDPLGYYAFVRPLDDQRHAVFIALDGEELPDHQGGIYAHVGHAQLEWLRSILACVKANHEHDLVFVFAHQPLSMLGVDPEDTNNNVDDVLNASPNVVGYFYGHHHDHAICGDDRSDHNKVRRTCAKFWEVETGSLVEFPQEMRMVRIKELGGGLGYLEVATFGEVLTDQSSKQAQFVKLARRGAERDHCATSQGARCSEDKRPYRTDGNDTAGRLFFRMP